MLFKPSQHTLVKLPAWRRRVLLVLVLFAFMGLMGRSVYLQAMHKDFLQAKGAKHYSYDDKLHAERGKILDRNKEILAISMPVDTILARPPLVKITDAQTRQMAKLLDMQASSLTKILRKPKQEVHVKRRVPPALATQIVNLKIPGIFKRKAYRRFYPAGDVASHIVGFTGIDNNGREGFEYHYNKKLSGFDGVRRVLRNRKGQVVEDVESIRITKNGEDLTLSIDRRIQYLAFRELAKAVTKHNAKAGTAVVLDAKTGEVLAMVNLPTYNPNNLRNLKGKMRNRALTDMFEPGSTMKPFSASAAMEFGDFKPNTPIQTAPGYLKIGTATIHDSHENGVLTVSQVIQKSSNVGSAKMALAIRREALWNTFNHLGFGTKTGIGFPGEARGRLRNYESWRPIEQATMSYGHGISTTLLQLARAYTVFANEGEMKPVSLMKLTENPIGNQVFSPHVANSMKDMLELVVQVGGTAPRAGIPGYRVAGKTGTAHKLKPTGGYEEKKYVSSFVGLVPASNPKFIMAVMIDDPSNGDYYGGTVAAPVFKAVMTDALRLLAVPQDAPHHNVVIPTDAPLVKEEV